MGLFGLTLSRDRKIMGSIPQISEIDSQYFEPGPPGSSFGLWQDRSIIPNVSGLRLDSESNLTDVLNCSFIRPRKGFLFSDRIIELLKEFNSPQYKIVKAKLVHQNQLIDGYSFLYFLRNLNDLLDFSNSVFQARVFTREGEAITIIDAPFENNSAYEYFQFKNSHKSKEGYVVRIELVKGRLREGCNYDFLLLSNFGAQLLVSEKLKDEMVAIGLSGCDFEPNPKFIYAADGEKTNTLKPFYLPYKILPTEFTEIPQNVIFINSDNEVISEIPTLKEINEDFILISEQEGKTYLMRMPHSFRSEIKNKQKRLEFFLETYIESLL